VISGIVDARSGGGRPGGRSDAASEQHEMGVHYTIPVPAHGERRLSDAIGEALTLRGTARVELSTE
jgi:hypothetical protein